MKSKFLSILFIFVLVLGALISLSSVYSESNSQVEKAVGYLEAQDPTPWSTVARAAAEGSGIDLTHLKSVPSDNQSSNSYAKYILALVSVGKDPTGFGEENYVDRLLDYYKNGQFGKSNLLNDDMWAILALGSIGKEYLPKVQDSKQFILSHQNSDGGWGVSTSSGSSADMTGAAIMALLEGGASSASSSITEAESYLQSIQNSDGGFPGWSGDSNASSDAWVISAIYKLGDNPTSSEWSTGGATTSNPVEHLKSLQDSQKGFFYNTEGGSGEDSFVVLRTSYAVIALEGKSYPVSTSFNLHSLRIEGTDNSVVKGKVNGGIPLDLIIEAAKSEDFDYSLDYYEDFDSFMVSQIDGEKNWKYKVNHISPNVGAGEYYLHSGDEVLWYTVGDKWSLEWKSTRVNKNDSTDSIEFQVQTYASSSWENLQKSGIKVKIGNSEFLTDSSGKVSISSNSLEEGFYEVYAKHQTRDENGDGGADIGYIRSKKINLTVGEVPESHKLGLEVEIEKVTAPEEGKQESISFSVNPGNLDFGKLKPGESARQDITISNGEAQIYLDPEVSGARVFQNNLNIGGRFWQFFSTNISPQKSRNLPVKMTIPGDYKGDFGMQKGEITFWATKK